MIEQIKKLIIEKTDGDTSGHGLDHVERVFTLAMKFASQEKANGDVVAIASLLHDVDDYKIVGIEKSKHFHNAKEIMAKVGIDNETQKQITEIIKTIGYSNSLCGVRPATLEGKIVSDADMCDAIGAHGIVRSIVYAVSPKGNGVIFDKDILPNFNITYEQYNSAGTTHDTDNAINHFFEKLLKLKDMMMTKSGKQEAEKRHKIMVDFLRNFFEEEGATQWVDLLKNF